MRLAASPCRGFARASLSQFGFHTLPVEIGENRGNRSIEVGWDRLSDFDRTVERARQRRVLDNRHAGPAGFRLDLFGQQISALGHDLGSFHGGEVEAKSHGIVRGVGEHHRGFSHIGFYAPAPHLPLQAADAAANLGTAFGLLELVAHVLLAHLQAGFAALPFDEVINRRPAEEQPRGSQHQAVDVRADLLQARRREWRNRELTRDPLHGEYPEQGRREQRLGQPGCGAKRKKVFDVRDRIDTVKFESHRLGVNVEAASLKDACAERRGGYGGHHQRGWKEHCHGQAAERNQRGLELRGLPAGRRSQARKAAKSPASVDGFGPSIPSAVTPASVPAAADSSRLCSISPSRRALSRRCCVACSVRSPGIGYPPRPAAGPGSENQPFGHVEQAGKARFNKSRPEGERTSEQEKSGKGLHGHRQIHDRQLRAQFAQQRHGDLDQHGCRKDGGGQLDRGEKDTRCGANDGQRGCRRECVGAQRDHAKASHHRGQHDAVQPGGDDDQRSHQLKQLAEQRRLDIRGRVEQVDQRETELYPCNLPGEQHHLVQQGEREPVDQADGQLAQQGRKTEVDPGSRQLGHQRSHQQCHHSRKRWP